eukprot:1153122-Pelagomonas_calceolata.AAC.2
MHTGVHARMHTGVHARMHTGVHARMHTRIRTRDLATGRLTRNVPCIDEKREERAKERLNDYYRRNYKVGGV